MAINTTNIGAGPNTIYTSSNDSAVTLMSFCNHGALTVSINIHVVPNGDSPTVDNLLAYQLDIDAGDTYIFYKGGEKLLLGNNDYISITASEPNILAAIVSHIGL